jgi:hypothetical protein
MALDADSALQNSLDINVLFEWLLRASSNPVKALIH